MKEVRIMKKGLKQKKKVMCRDININKASRQPREKVIPLSVMIT